MTFQKKDNTGALFPNKEKTSEKHPTHRGDCLIDGTEYWVAGWVKESKGQRYMSLSFTPKEPSVFPSPVDDSVPF